MNEIIVTKDPVETPVAPATGVPVAPVKVDEIIVQTMDEKVP